MRRRPSSPPSHGALARWLPSCANDHPRPRQPPVRQRERSCANGHPRSVWSWCANGHPSVRRRPPLQAPTATLFFLQMSRFAGWRVGSGACRDPRTTTGSGARAGPPSRPRTGAMPAAGPNINAAAGRAGAGARAAYAGAGSAGRGRRAGAGAAIRRAGVQELLRRTRLPTTAGCRRTSRGNRGDQHATARCRARAAASGLADRRGGGVRGSRSPSPRGAQAPRRPAGDGLAAMADRHRPRRRGAPDRARAAAGARRERRGDAGCSRSPRALAGPLRPRAEHRVQDWDPQRRRPRAVAERLRAPASRLPARPRCGGEPASRWFSIKFGTPLRGSGYAGEQRRC